MKQSILFLAFYLSLTMVHAQSADDTTGSSGTVFKKKTISISPASLYFNAAKGESQTLKVNIENGLDSAYSFRVSLSDFSRNENSEVRYSKPGTTSNSCAQWVTISNNLIEVAPHSAGSVDVTLSVPDTLSGIEKSTWAMVLLETMSEKVLSETHGDINANIERAYRVAVQVYQTPPSVMNKEIRMTDFVAMLERGKYRVTCVNEGGVLLRCNSYIELVSKESGEKIRVYPKKEGTYPFKVLPGQMRNVDFEVPANTPAGKYTAIAIVDANDDEVPLEAAQLEVELK